MGSAQRSEAERSEAECGRRATPNAQWRCETIYRKGQGGREAREAGHRPAIYAADAADALYRRIGSAVETLCRPCVVLHRAGKTPAQPEAAHRNAAETPQKRRGTSRRARRCIGVWPLAPGQWPVGSGRTPVRCAPVHVCISAWCLFVDS